MSSFSMKKTVIHVIAISLALVTGIAYTHNVPVEPTPGDKVAIQQILRSAGYADLLDTSLSTYEAQISAILKVQHAVLAWTPENDGIPMGQAREPADLLKARKGLCYDRSRSIEKALELLGIETRHLSIYSTKGTTPLRAFFTPRSPSHAVTEARTLRGWLVIDSNARWISLNEADEPIPVDRLSDIGRRAKWAKLVPDSPSSIFLDPFMHIYGLYSRHGRFYPPMNVIPDINWADAVANVMPNKH